MKLIRVTFAFVVLAASSAPMLPAQENRDLKDTVLVQAKVHYGEKELQYVNAFLLKSDRPTPVILTYHAGGWAKGMPISHASFREDSEPMKYLRAGMSWVGDGVGTITVAEFAAHQRNKPERLVAPFDSAEARGSQAAWSKYLGTEIETVNQCGLKMILIPPGSFPRQNEDLGKDKAQVPLVAVDDPYRISATEVTIGQFKRFAAATGYLTEAEKLAIEAKTNGRPAESVRTAPVSDSFRQLQVPIYRNPGYESTDEFPAAVISWNDARAFCNWLSEQEKVTYRLATEAEWEYACRAGAKTRYTFGDDPQQLELYAWHGTISGGEPHAVATKRANAFGLYDVHGNVWEWCLDPYDDSPESQHVIRGGYWRSPASNCGCAVRKPATRYLFHGFRCVSIVAVASRNSDDEEVSFIDPIEPLGVTRLATH